MQTRVVSPCLSREWPGGHASSGPGLHNAPPARAGGKPSALRPGQLLRSQALGANNQTMPEDRFRSLTSLDQNGARRETLFSPESRVCCFLDQRQQPALSRLPCQGRPQGPNPQLEGAPASLLKMTGLKATASLWPSRMATGVQNLLQDQLHVHLDHQTQEDSGLRFSWRTRSPDSSKMLLPSLLPQTFLWVSPSGLSQKHQRSGKDGEPTLTSPVQGLPCCPVCRVQSTP